MKVFIFDPLWDQLITPSLIARLSAAKLDVMITSEIAPLSNCRALFEGSEDRILCINPDYVGWKLPAADYAAIPNLKGILGAATSFHWIDRTVADERRIPICNIRGFSTEAVAEWAIAMAFNLARQIARLIKADFPLDFDSDFMRYRGIELHGRTAGIIGLGQIGSAIARRCAGLGMRVQYWSRTARSESYHQVTLDNLLAHSDVVFVALANNPETKLLLTPERLSTLRSSALFISVVHGLYDEKQLISMVQRGSLFGYGYEAAPGTFKQHEGNVWAAPAYGWATDKSMLNSLTLWIEGMIEASAGRFPNRV